MAPNIEHFNFSDVRLVRISRPSSFADIARELNPSEFDDVAHAFRAEDPVEVITFIVPELKGRIRRVQSFSLKPGDKFACFRVIWGVPSDRRRRDDNSLMKYVKSVKMIVFHAVE
jgi:hypothetical protein